MSQRRRRHFRHSSSLCKRVLNVDLPWLNSVVRATRLKRLPTALRQHEAKRVVANLPGAYWLIGGSLYGSGLRLSEALRLRVKDVELELRRILVRDGKGAKDRVTLLSATLINPLRAHLIGVGSMSFRPRIPASIRTLGRGAGITSWKNRSSARFEAPHERRAS